MFKIGIASFITSAVLLANTTFYVGKTYDFAERDIIDAIQAHIQNNGPSIEKKYEELKQHAMDKMTTIAPKLKSELPFATEDKEYFAKTHYTNPKDIKDANGKILYKAGYTFDPMDYISLPYAIVFINATRTAEIAWLKRSEMLNSAHYRILITQGSYLEATKALGQHVFFANDAIIHRMGIKATPSVVIQEKNRLKIKEVRVNEPSQTD